MSETPSHTQEVQILPRPAQNSRAGRGRQQKSALASAAGFPGGSEVNLPAVQEIWSYDPSVGKIPGERNPLHYHGSENSTDCIVHESQVQTRLSTFHLLSCTPHFQVLSPEMGHWAPPHLSPGGPPPERHFVSHRGLNPFLYRVLVRCNSHIIQFTQESA